MARVLMHPKPGEMWYKEYKLLVFLNVQAGIQHRIETRSLP